MWFELGELDDNTELIPQEVNKMLMQLAISKSQQLVPPGVSNHDLTYALYRASLLGYSVGVRVGRKE